MGTSTLGRLEKVDLREVWKTEACDFTPWLAQEDNIAILGETIGIDLEVEAQEKEVGPFRADILCKDTLTDHWVLIENQLESTDHTHLGQLLTYAAGLNAVSIVWIAEKFSEEHRATLDWLNEITDSRFNFFGLEVELWRIGGSPIAPKFNIVCKPNDWSKTVSEAAKAQSGNMTDTKRLQLEYWTALREFLLKNSKVIRPQKPLPQHWTNYAIGRSHCYLIATANTRDRRIGVALVLTGPDSKANFHFLKAEKETIEKAIGSELDWRELPDKKESHLFLLNAVDPAIRSEWASQHAWLKSTLEVFHKVLAPRVKSIPSSGNQIAPGEELASTKV